MRDLKWPVGATSYISRNLVKTAVFGGGCRLWGQF